MHRDLSPRRMKRWLDRRCSEANKGRRMGLAPYRLGSDGYIVGERVRMKVPMAALGMVAVRPVVIGVARMMENYTWAHIKSAKVELADESLGDRIHAYRAAQSRAIQERKDALLDEMTDRFSHIVKKRPFVAVPR